MADRREKTRKIDLGKEFGDVCVIVNGVRIEVSADGRITYAGTAEMRAAGNDNAGQTGSGAPEPGERMPDGTVYVGYSPDSGRPMYAMPGDAPQLMKWSEAASYAAGVNAHGYKDWHVPTPEELNDLYENRHRGALKDTFNESGAFPAGWYWSSREHNDLTAFQQNFAAGRSDWNFKDSRCAVRLVRS